MASPIATAASSHADGSATATAAAPSGLDDSDGTSTSAGTWEATIRHRPADQEAVDRRLGEQVGEGAGAQQAEEEPDDADHHGEHGGIGDELRGTRRRQRSQGAEGQQAGHRHRPGLQIGRGARTAARIGAAAAA